jgi:hypothetical protein
MPHNICSKILVVLRSNFVSFQVNGVDLAEIEGGEVAITNLHSCNGPEFVFQLRFFFKQASTSTQSPGK